jgi:hypothetical protein
MRGKVLSAGLIAACAACLCAPGGAVAGTLDQQQPTITGSGNQIQATQSVAQTFTAGLTGGVDRVDLGLGKGGADANLTAPLIVEIRNVSGGVPGTTVLATASVPPAAVPPTAAAAFVPINFGTPAPVVAGSQYAIVAYSSEPNTRYYSWAYALSDPYPAGAFHFTASSPPNTNWSSPAGTDQSFKTYVAPTGKRAAALKKCKKKKSKKKRKKCRKKANKLPR